MLVVTASRCLLLLLPLSRRVLCIDFMSVGTGAPILNRVSRVPDDVEICCIILVQWLATVLVVTIYRLAPI